MVVIASGCCCRATNLVAVRQVSVVPVVPVVSPVIQPVILDAGYVEPLDVTTTTIDFY